MAENHSYHPFFPSVPTLSERMVASVRTASPYKGRGTSTDAPDQQYLDFADGPGFAPRKPMKPPLTKFLDRLKAARQRELAQREAEEASLDAPLLGKNHGAIE